MSEIKGRSAVVTGGGSGIGMGLAKELARRGAKVGVADIILDNARKVVDEIRSAGGTAVALQCDVCDRDSVNKMKTDANAAIGPVQLVFANAGATSFERLVDMSDNDVDWIIQVNLMGCMYTVRAFLPDMIAGSEGHVMATSSMAGLLPSWIPVHVPYSAAKMGIIGLLMNLAVEVKEHNIHTTLYCPGGVQTSMGQKNGSYRPAKFGGPVSGALRVPTVSHKGNKVTFYTPDAIAPMVLNAVTNNRPFVFDHPEQRRFFKETYASIVEACYDDSEAYERDCGQPEVVGFKGG
jgi:NAD(P)-dependent dehydrogenase (short-subunit alcohol dehydrogenase family)